MVKKEEVRQDSFEVSDVLANKLSEVILRTQQGQDAIAIWMDGKAVELPDNHYVVLDAKYVIKFVERKEDRQ